MTKADALAAHTAANDAFRAIYSLELAARADYRARRVDGPEVMQAAIAATAEAQAVVDAATEAALAIGAFDEDPEDVADADQLAFAL